MDFSQIKDKFGNPVKELDVQSQNQYLLLMIDHLNQTNILQFNISIQDWVQGYVIQIKSGLIQNEIVITNKNDICMLWVFCCHWKKFGPVSSIGNLGIIKRNQNFYLQAYPPHEDIMFDSWLHEASYQLTPESICSLKTELKRFMDKHNIKSQIELPDKEDIIIRTGNFCDNCSKKCEIVFEINQNVCCKYCI